MTEPSNVKMPLMCQRSTALMLGAEQVPLDRNGRPMGLDPPRPTILVYVGECPYWAGDHRDWMYINIDPVVVRENAR